MPQSAETEAIAPIEHPVILVLDLATENPIWEADLMRLIPGGAGAPVHRASEEGCPRSPRGTPDDWPRAARALDRLVARARGHERGGVPCRYWVTGRAGLPAFLYVGYLLTKHARVTLVSSRDAGPLDVLDLDRHREGDPPAAVPFLRLELPPASHDPVDAQLVVAVRRAIAPALLPGRAQRFAAHADGTLDGSTVGAAVSELATLAGELAARAPRRTRTGVYVAGPATLAFLVGRSLSPSLVPDLDVLQHRDGAYELALEIRRSRSIEIQTIVFASGDTHETRGLSLGREFREIQDALRASEHRDRFEPHHVPAARPEDLAAAVRRYQPEVLHLCGHGAHAGVGVPDDDGASALLAPAALTTILKEASRPVRLVVINACHGADQLSAILGAAECGIGLVGAVHDEDARRFAAALYRALGDGRSVRAAFESAAQVLGGAAAPAPQRGVVSLLAEALRAGAPRAICVHRDDVDPSAIELVRGRTRAGAPRAYARGGGRRRRAAAAPALAATTRAICARR